MTTNDLGDCGSSSVGELTKMGKFEALYAQTSPFLQGKSEDREVNAVSGVVWAVVCALVDAVIFPVMAVGSVVLLLLMLLSSENPLVALLLFFLLLLLTYLLMRWVVVLTTQDPYCTLTFE